MLLTLTKIKKTIMTKLEILDNRNHKEGLDIYEGGYGKWYAFNPVNSRIIGCRFKWEAQEVIDNPRSTDILDDFEDY